MILRMRGMRCMIRGILRIELCGGGPHIQPISSKKLGAHTGQHITGSLGKRGERKTYNGGIASKNLLREIEAGREAETRLGTQS